MITTWTYIDAAIAFNPLVSFQVVIMLHERGAVTFQAVLGVLCVYLLIGMATSRLD